MLNIISNAKSQAEKSIDSSNVLLRLEKLTTGYKSSQSNQSQLHSNLNCNIVEGELIAMLGPNGAGKSTLIKTLTGMVPALHGDVRYNGKNLRHMSNKEVAREVALVLTDKIDDRYLTAFDIVGTGRYPYGSFMGRLTKTDKEIINNALMLVDADELQKRFFYSLSDGEKQKVLLARAIAQDTPLIFLDEPTAFIDSPGKVVIMNILSNLVLKHKKSILLTTHDTELALNYATKLWLLGKGSFFTQGNPDELVKSGMINKLFDRKGVVFNAATRKFESNPDML